MKKSDQKSQKDIHFPKLAKMSTFNQTHETVSYQRSAQSSVTIRMTQKIPNKQSPRFFDYLISKVSNEDKLYVPQDINNNPVVQKLNLSQKLNGENSIMSKHYYNLDKRLNDLNEVLGLVQEMEKDEEYEIEKVTQELKNISIQAKDRRQKCEGMSKQLEELKTKYRDMVEAKVTKNKLPQTSKTLNDASKKKAIIQSPQSQNRESKRISRSQWSLSSLKPFVQREKTQKKTLQQPQEVASSVSQFFISKEILMALWFAAQIKEKQSIKESLQRNLDILSKKIPESKDKKNELIQSLNAYQKEKIQVESEMIEIHQEKSKIKNEVSKMSSTIQQYESRNAQVFDHLSDLKLINFLIVTPIQELYLSKKTLNNQLQQIRGSIRVYCRIRPIKSTQTLANYQIKSHDLLQIKKTLEEKKSSNMITDFQFVFDRIFDQKTSQQEVFNEISQLIQTAIDGVNVCIFAYGQTGSGKTFTMQGNNSKGTESVGLIPRSTELIFAELQKYNQNGWQTALEVSINEIYNDSVINLLEKSENKVFKAVFTPTKSVKEVEDLFAKASSKRSTAFTLSNADSSRSHLIFILRITAINHQSSQARKSQLVLVDLAGSERVKQSGVENDRLKEAQHINLSLSELGQVLKSLKVNKGKTSFRNSKLTYFLEPYLQKGSKAIMFVNISPSISDESQSINSLKFASGAREIKLQAD